MVRMPRRRLPRRFLKLKTRRLHLVASLFALTNKGVRDDDYGEMEEGVEENVAVAMDDQDEQEDRDIGNVEAHVDDRDRDLPPHMSTPPPLPTPRGDLYELYHYLNYTVLFGVSLTLLKAAASNTHD